MTQTAVGMMWRHCRFVLVCTVCGRKNSSHEREAGVDIFPRKFLRMVSTQDCTYTSRYRQSQFLVASGVCTQAVVIIEARDGRSFPTLRPFVRAALVSSNAVVDQCNLLIPAVLQRDVRDSRLQSITCDVPRSNLCCTKLYASK